MFHSFTVRNTQIGFTFHKRLELHLYQTNDGKILWLNFPFVCIEFMF